MQDLDSTFKNARNNNFELSDKSFTSLFRLTKVKPVDDYGNTLLHIATEHENQKYVGELLNAGYDENSTNKFGKSSWDIAVASRNKTMINKFVDHKITTATAVEVSRVDNLQQTVNTLTKKRKELEDSVNNLETANKKLTTLVTKYESADSDRSKEITLLTRSKAGLLTEVSNLKHSLSDVQSDNVVLKNTNKRLREENEELKGANKKLKSSVEALLTASMK
jgi:ankyrin repeat protein